MELEEAAETVQQIVSGAMGMNDFLMPVLALVCWTIIMWFWMYVTRIPAMQKAGIDPNDARHPAHMATVCQPRCALWRTITITCMSSRRSSMH